jgi:hypothetical protein
MNEILPSSQAKSVEVDFNGFQIIHVY